MLKFWCDCEQISAWAETDEGFFKKVRRETGTQRLGQSPGVVSVGWHVLPGRTVCTVSVIDFPNAGH